MEIKNVKDAKEVSDIVIGKMVQANICYISLIVDHGNGIISHCFFSPVTPVRRTGEHLLMADDYAKIIFLLLSHPNIKNIEYIKGENCIQAVFKCHEMQEFYEERGKYDD